MAATKVAIFLTILLLPLIFEMDNCRGPCPLVDAQKIDCNARCSYRCSKASRHKLCMRDCKTCCKRCNCVPPGTSGNEDVCPCYANMTTHNGKHKCP